METLIVIVGGIVGTAAIIVPLAMLRGFVLSTMWAWFVVPLGLPAIGIALAIGLSLTVGLFSGLSPKRDEKPWVQIAAGFVAPLLTLFCGWLVHMCL